MGHDSAHNVSCNFCNFDLMVILGSIALNTVVRVVLCSRAWRVTRLPTCPLVVGARTSGLSRMRASQNEASGVRGSHVTFPLLDSRWDC